MVSSDKKLANVVGGKSARACDNCVRKRARWYCAADDAFLCQSCDSSVHSANPLARRHERVRLKSDVSSIKNLNERSRVRLRVSVPSWHRGFARKARTPRKNKLAKCGVGGAVGPDGSRIRLVPEISGEENSQEESEEQLLYRVPVFDPLVAELCTSVNSSEAGNNVRVDGDAALGFWRGSKTENDEFGEDIGGFLSSEMDLAEFAADVESLLGKGLEDEMFDIEGLGILEDERESKCCLGSGRVKVEDEEAANLQIDGDQFIGFGRDTFELNFDYDDSANNGEEEEDCKEKTMEPVMTSNLEYSYAKKISLRLDYEGVMSAWDEHKSPWTTGERPQLNPDDCLGLSGTMHVYGMVGGQAAAVVAGDGGREARVSRYREKRRTRLFSKKIRYEVRKLNAEKRPRMKGRFVKRANLVAPAAFALLGR